MGVVKVLAEFPTFAIDYEPLKNPFFEPIVIDNLRIIKSVAIGRMLISSIQAAAPKVRNGFPDGINVILQPMENGMHYHQSGFGPLKQWLGGLKFKLDGMKPSSNPGHNLTRQSKQGGQTKTVNCPFWKDGTSLNKAGDVDAAGNGNGSTCHVSFSNAQFLTSKGEITQSFIVLAHELIHSLHCLEGIHFGDKEEQVTAGDGVYSSDEMTEAGFRRAFGLPPRAAYY